MEFETLKLSGYKITMKGSVFGGGLLFNPTAQVASPPPSDAMYGEGRGRMVSQGREGTG